MHRHGYRYLAMTDFADATPEAWAKSARRRLWRNDAVVSSSADLMALAPYGSFRCGLVLAQRKLRTVFCRQANPVSPPFLYPLHLLGQ